MLPEFKSGVMRILAWPWMLEVGNFLAAISGLMAASSCISPSISQSGWFLRNLVNHEMDFGEVGILAAGTVGGVGKHGDFGGLIGVFGKSGSGVFDYGVELLLGGKFVDAAVSERKGRVVLFADEATGKISRI